MDSSENKTSQKKSWNIFNSCLFNYGEKEAKSNPHSNDTGRSLRSSIVLNSINSGTNANSNPTNIYHTNAPLGINSDTQNNGKTVANSTIQNGNKQQKSQFSNNGNSEKKVHRETFETYNNSFFTSGMNTPIMEHNFKGFDATASDKKLGGGVGGMEKDKTFACSLDANNMEHLQKMIEKKQVKDQQWQQQIDQQVKQKFPMEKIFFLRDQENKYNTLAKCTSQHFYINIGTFNNSVVSNSNRPNQAILNNTNMLFKANPSQNITSSKLNNISQDSCNTSQNTSTMFSSSKISYNNVEFLNYQNLYVRFKVDSDQQDNFTPQKIALHIAQGFKKFPLLIDACCGAGGNTIQFSKFNKMVIAVDKSLKVLNTCVENWKNHRQEKNQNVEFIHADFLSLECGEFGQMRADIVFINPQVEIPQDSQKPDIFKHTSPNILKAMKNGYRMSKNIAVLLPFYIDVNQIPILLDRFYRSLPLDMIQHHCPHIELIYMNGKIKYYLIKLGDVSKITQEDEIKFLQEYIRDNSYYKGPYEEKVLELLGSINRKVGMKKLISCIVKSIDINDLQKQKNLLNSFIDELQKEKLLQDKEIKSILNITNGVSNNMCDSVSDFRDSSNNFINSQTSMHSFQIDVQYGSNAQSPQIDQLSPPVNNSKAYSLDISSSQCNNSGLFNVVESSLGDRLGSEEDDEDLNDDHSFESDFYFDEHNNIPIDGQKMNLNLNAQVKSI